jgi:hypothetical protein
MNKDQLTVTEQKLLDELNYKAKLILDIEEMFQSNKMPVDSKRLYDFDIPQLENILLVWNNGRK